MGDIGVAGGLRDHLADFAKNGITRQCRESFVDFCFCVGEGDQFKSHNLNHGRSRRRFPVAPIYFRSE